MVVSSDSMKNATATSQGNTGLHGGASATSHNAFTDGYRVIGATIIRHDRVDVIESEGLGRIGRRGSRLVFLRYLELCVAVGVDGDGDEIWPAAYRTVLGVDLPRATARIHEGVVLLAAERACVGHGFSGYGNE
jgi:hypothetical protein